MLRGTLAIGVTWSMGCGLVAPLDGLAGGGAALPDASVSDEAGSDAAPDIAAESSTDALEAAADSPPATECDAGLTACGAQCVDPQADGTNCGRCGHDCGGGACAGGGCLPVTLVSGLAAPRDLKVSGATVYFTTHGSPGIVGACATSGCGSSPAVLAQGLALGAGITVSGASLFFASYGAAVDGGYTGNGAFACTTSGCATPAPLSASPGNPVGITDDGSLVYWNDSTLGEILSCAIGGCAGKPTVIAKAQSGPWYGIAVDANRTYVYWGARAAGTIDRCDLPACANGVQTIATGLAGPFDLALDAANVYFTSYDPANPTNPATGTVQSCALTGCGSGHQVYAAPQVTPSGIAVDASHVYWAGNGDGTIVYCAKSGCPATGPLVLAANQKNPYRITLDASFVYWTNTGGGTVMRVAKP